jgi:type IV fimbrial biogenesis protein FimT
MKAKQSGFSMLELMFAIGLLAAIVTIGVPNLRDFVRNSRMSSAANDVITDFNLARSEAVKRRVPVTLCKSQTLTSCDVNDAAGPFESWIVFVDDADPALVEANDGNGAVNTGEVILRQRELADTLTVRKPANQRRAIFLPTGFPRTGAANVNRLLICDERGNTVGVGGDSAARAIQVLPTGRPSVFRAIATVTTFEAIVGACP